MNKATRGGRLIRTEGLILQLSVNQDPEVSLDLGQ